MKKIIILCILLFHVHFVFAQDINLSLEKNINWQNTITTTENISNENIENKVATQALEPLENSTGVFVQKTGDVGRTDPVIRGFGDSCRKIVLLIDGKPEQMSLFGCGVSQSMLVGNIDRIEVTKGPDSVLYGSGALGGAINIITKMPTKKFEGNIDFYIGSFNTQNAKIYLGGIQNNIIYEVAANKVSTDGHLENSQYNATDLYEKLGYVFNDGGKLQIQAKQYSGLKHEPEPYPQNYWEDYQRGSICLSYDKSFSRSDISLKLYDNYGEHKFSDGYHSKDSLIGAIANFNLEVCDYNFLKTGLEYRQQYGKLIDGNPLKYTKGSWKTYDYSVFALDKHNFTDKLSAVLGARYNNDEISGNFLAYRGGIDYKFTDVFLVKGLYSKGFRNPYLNELYVVPAKNPNLKQEEVNNYELGVNISKNNLVVDITGFIMKGDNLIQKQENKIKPPMYTFQNVGNYEFKGIEFFTSYEFNKYIKATAGYTYFNSGYYTQGRPESKIDSEIDFKLNKWTLALTGMFVGEYYAKNNKQDRLDDFTVVSAKLSYEINNNIKLFVDGKNLTNQKYEIFVDRESDGYPILEMPGASVYFGTTIKF